MSHSFSPAMPKTAVLPRSGACRASRPRALLCSAAGLAGFIVTSYVLVATARVAAR